MVYFAITVVSSFIVSGIATFFMNVWLTERITIAGEFIGLQPSKNTGIAFGMDLGSYQAFFILIALAIVAIVAIRTAKTLVEQIGFGLIIGGGLANVADRSLSGHVHDVFQIGTFPIFNVADICINMGIAMLIVKGLLDWNKTRRQ